MILTSSAAGSMVISNMDSAGQQAQDTFDGSLDMAANYMEIRSVVGVCDPAQERLIGLELLVTLGSGSGELNLSSMVVELVLADSLDILTLGDDLQAEKVLSGGRTNSTSVIGRGDIYSLSFALPQEVGCNDALRITILPVNGFATSILLSVPDTMTATFISLR
jgi:archaellin